MTTYRVERRDGLLIMHDPMLIDDLNALGKTMPKGSVMCQLCAAALGAVIVAGTREDINAERTRLGIKERV